MSAIVNVNAYADRGSEPADLNLIPFSMVDHIEILRDGAAALYGSDAIAGVINIILKKDSEGGEAHAQVGGYGWKDGLTTQGRHQQGSEARQQGRLLRHRLRFRYAEQDRPAPARRRGLTTIHCQMARRTRAS